MIGTNLDFEPLSRDCVTVLQTYSVRDLAAKSSVADYAGWLDRVEQVPGIDAAALSTIHGFLMAQGMLKFEITGRSLGLQYQLSTSGREALLRRTAVAADDGAQDEDPPDAMDSECLEPRHAA